MRLETITERKSEVIEIAKRHGAKNIRIFGSVARGDNEYDSDIDFIVDLDKGRSLLDLGGLLYDLEQLFGRRVDVVTEKGLRPRIRDRVLREARQL